MVCAFRRFISRRYMQVVHVVPGMRGGGQEELGGNRANDIILTFMVQPMYIDELHEEMYGHENDDTQA